MSRILRARTVDLECGLREDLYEFDETALFLVTEHLKVCADALECLKPHEASELANQAREIAGDARLNKTLLDEIRDIAALDVFGRFHQSGETDDEALAARIEALRRIRRGHTKPFTCAVHE